MAGKGWQLLMRANSAAPTLADRSREILRQIGAAVASFGAAGDSVDLDGTYEAWFDRLGVDAVLVRPDLYIFGTSSLAEVDALVQAVPAMLGIGDRQLAYAD